MKHIFGPVTSRRLGLSLGIDLLPAKVCNFDCIYCEVGKTTVHTCERRDYIPTAVITTEIDEFLLNTNKNRLPDVFTVTASGEPTLHSGIGSIISHIKQRAKRPVAVITNGSLLHLPEVREELAAADIVIPSLDSARLESFRRINRPASCVSLEAILEGLTRFSKCFSGEYWLEVLLAKGINDSPEDLMALQRAVSMIKPGRVQLNTVARPPLESFAKPLDREELERIAQLFDEKVEIIVDFRLRKHEKHGVPSEEEIVAMLRRRPCSGEEVWTALQLSPEATRALLDDLTKRGRILRTTFEDKIYYQAVQEEVIENTHEQ